jgi:hypothetical protein
MNKKKLLFPNNLKRLSQSVRKRKFMWLGGSLLILAAAGLGLGAYFQSFETDTFDWTGATRVMTGTHGVMSKVGAFHAEDQNMSGLTFTRWSGYSRTFPPGGYTTTIDIYLDISPPYMNGSLTPYPNDTRFDWDSAIGDPACGFRRDFVFNAGFYTDTDTTGAGPRFVISASNNAGRAGANPKNPGRAPFTVNVEGWYTFEHRFRDNGAGILAVDLTLKNAAGTPLMTWTLSDSSDVIGTTVGGNRYGWFVIDEFPYLAFDNSALIGFQDYCAIPASTEGAKVTGGGWIPWANDKGTFGLTAKATSATDVSGNLTYQDHSVLGRTVKSTSITYVSVSGNCADIGGTATVNGAGSYGFQVRVCDNSEPGTNFDTFIISMSDGYMATGILAGGNIQLH